MERGERIGLGTAIVGHALLFAALSLSIAHRTPPVKAVAETMDVQLVDAVGLKSAAPEPATEAPQEAQAPEAGLPQDAPSPAAEPTPAPPAPTPPPAPVAKPTPAKPTPPAPVAEKPAKPAPVAKPVSTRPLSDILKDVRSAARSEKIGAAPAATGERASGPKLGPDFLKGVLGAAAGKGTSARATLSGPAMNGLGAAIKRQIQPCYDLGGLGGTPAMTIVTVLQLRFNADGSVAGTPQLVEQQGLNEANRRYAAQMVDVSRRAVLKCAPLKLPAELYAGGWENITMGFIPGQLR